MQIERKDESVVNVLSKAFLHCTNEGADDLRKKIIQVLVYSGTDCQTPSKKNDDVLSDYADQVLEAMKNYSLKLSEKDKQTRVDPRIARTALASWLSTPHGYRIMKEISIEIFPSERTLYRMQKQLRQCKGMFAKVYGWFRDERNQRSDDHPIVGVLADELNLKTDVYSNIKDNSVIAFAATEGFDSIDLISEIKTLSPDLSPFSRLTGFGQNPV